jgi:hypothetical protein
MHPFIEAQETLFQGLILSDSPVYQVVINGKVFGALEARPVPLHTDSSSVDVSLKDLEAISKTAWGQDWHLCYPFSFKKKNSAMNN